MHLDTLANISWYLIMITTLLSEQSFQTPKKQSGNVNTDASKRHLNEQYHSCYCHRLCTVCSVDSICAKKKKTMKKKTLSTIHLIKHRGGGDTDWEKTGCTLDKWIKACWQVYKGKNFFFKNLQLHRWLMKHFNLAEHQQSHQSSDSSTWKSPLMTY